MGSATDQPIFDNAVLKWLQVILNERFGQAFILEQTSSEHLRLNLDNAPGGITFDVLERTFFSPDSDLPFTLWDASKEGWKTVFDKPLPAPGANHQKSPLIVQTPDSFVIHYDLLGLTYWMLSRQEEVASTNLDQHLRFPATSSHAYKHGYLDRPVVDEWLHILRQVINRQWPNLSLKQSRPRTLVSCDIDNPYLPYTSSLQSTARVVMGDLLKRKSLNLAFKTSQIYILARRGNYRHDPYMNAINWIMDVNEQIGNTVAFNIIPEHLNTFYDGCYDINEPVIRDLLRRISARGHKIGLHTSYESYDRPEQIKREAEILRTALLSEQIYQYKLGGRQHYLRWNVFSTASSWEAASMEYDSTLGYADFPGFRCGTCFEYPMFDPIKRVALNLRQRPLVLMEGSVLESGYMDMGYSEEAFAYMHLIKQRCLLVGGDFTLLWHNSYLTNLNDRLFYQELIK